MTLKSSTSASLSPYAAAVARSITPLAMAAEGEAKSP